MGAYKDAPNISIIPTCRSASGTMEIDSFKFSILSLVVSVLLNDV